MRKVLTGILLIAVFLTGCGVEQTMETVADENAAPVMASPREIYVELPGQAASPAVESGSDRMYQCDSYDIYVQTLPGADYRQTVRTLSGHDAEDLTVMQTKADGFDCWEFVWACAGETGDQVGRARILSDGNYHYCVSVLGDASAAMENQVYWNDLFQSFTLH